MDSMMLMQIATLIRQGYDNAFSPCNWSLETYGQELDEDTRYQITNMIMSGAREASSPFMWKLVIGG